MIYIICIGKSNIGIAQTKLCDTYGFSTPDRTLSGNYTQFLYIQNEDVYISGNTSFSNNTIFRNCNIKINGTVTISGTGGGQLKTISFDNCRLFSDNCSTMWKGIRVNNAHLRLYGNTKIEDAEIAVGFVGTGGLLTTINSDFNRNWKCIDVEHSISNAPNVSFVQFTGNTFRCSSALNANVSNNNWCIAGVSLRYLNNNTLMIGANASNINLFENIACGIYAIDANVKIENCRFRRIGDYASYFWRGNAVFFSPLTKTRSLTITGLGKQPSSTSTFQDCLLTNVLSEGNADITITNSKSVNADPSYYNHNEGIVVKRNTGGSVFIYDNYFEQQNSKTQKIGLNGVASSRRIIRLEDCINLWDGDIVNNEIYCQNLRATTTDSNYVGIHLNNVNLANDALFLISNNIIRQYRTPNSLGIVLLSSRFISLSGNDFIRYAYELTTANNRPGIHIQGGSNHFIKFNRFYTDRSIDGHVGIRVTASNKPTLCSNLMYNERIGLMVEGTCEQLYSSANLFGSGQDSLTPVSGVIGLHYLSGTRTNIINRHTGNYWAGTFSQREARHDGMTWSVNRYFVKNNNYGTGVKYWPTSITPGFGWFVHNDSAINTCVNTVVNPDLDGYTPYCDTFIFNALPEPVKWDNMQNMIRHIQDHDLADELGCLEPLYDSLLTTRLPDYLEVARKMDSLYLVDTTLLDELISIQEGFNELDSAIQSELSLLANSETDSTVVSQYILDSLYSESNELKESRDSIMEIILENLYAKVEALMDMNALLAAGEDFEIFEKFLNRIQLTKFLTDTINSEDLDSLIWISNQCINEYGISVIRAHNLLPDSLLYFREPLMYCEEPEEILLGNNSARPLSFTISPNPVQDVLNIEMATEYNERLNWRICSITDGKSILTGDSQMQSMKNIDLSSLGSGIFFIQLYDQKGKSEIRRFVKIDD